MPPLQSPQSPPAAQLPVSTVRHDSGDVGPRSHDGVDTELSRSIYRPAPEDVPLPLSVTGHGSDDHENETAGAPSANNSANPTSRPVSNNSQATVPAKLLLTAVEEATQEPDQEMKMSLIPSEIHVIKRLSERVNVLPIISRADTMTNERLEEVKNAIRQDLKKAGLGFSLLGNIEENEEDEDGVDGDEEDEEDYEPDVRRVTNGDQKMDRHVVRIRPTRPSTGRRSSHSMRSRSRARAALTQEDVANSDDSGGPLTLTDLRKVIPFAIMSPDPVPSSSASQMKGLASSTSSLPSPLREGDAIVSHSEFLAELRGKYTRNYRWGSVDVLGKLAFNMLLNYG